MLCEEGVEVRGTGFHQAAKRGSVHLTLMYEYEKRAQACDNPETLGVCSENGGDGRRKQD